MTAPHSKFEQTAGGLRCAAASDVGMRRANNQDSMAIALAESPERWARQGHLLVVADGMGAHAAGELASKLATDNIPHSYHKKADQSPGEAIAESLREANNTIHTKGENSVDFQGMGTTCSCLLLLPQGAMAAHVGDSRVYRLRSNRFEQLTFDHSLVWELAAAGQGRVEEVPAYVPKNVITRSLGPHPTVVVDLEGPFPLRAGDRFLLCSDGLTGPLSPELIGMVLSSLPLEEVPQSLIDLANLLGGPDNITTVVAEIVDPSKLGEAAASDPPETLGVGSTPRRSAAHPTVWVAMAISAVLAILMAAIDQTFPAILAGLGFCISALLAWVQQRSQPRSSSSDQPPMSRQGKAPYRSHESEPSAANIETLSDIVRQLEDMQGKRDWDFDWEPIHESRCQAEESATRGDYQAAVVAYCSTVRQLMEGLRNSPPEKPSDSSVDL